MNASLNEKLRTVKWGEFKLTDVFTVKNTSNILACEIVEGSGTVPYLCASSENNAVSTYIDYDEKYIEKGNCIFIGGKTFVVTYQENDFYSNDSHNLALYLKEGIKSKATLLCMASCIYKSLCQKYSWGNSISKAKIQDDIITLPITTNGLINFEFMESFIAELEEERVAELSAYLTVSGLDNYELSSKETAIIEKLKNKQIPFAEFEFIEVFNNIKQGRRLKKDDQLPGSIPFVMSGTTNTGVVGYISNPVAEFPKNSITIDIFGNSFYRNYDFGAGDDTGVYWSTENHYSKTSMLFFTTAMKRALRGKYSYGEKLRSSQSLHFKMQLPTKDNTPDYDTMETLISAVQKLVIKDVVIYADRKIQKIKEVTKSEG
ncbi:MAG: restriction endonuclease subunit S [Lachnospiraceae bacterium]|jgi:hypothetical protein|nr:restriction endonuclease subunit S [Lachnospiraceae bacterium]MCI9591816.1 restriction endonuclease subunit S [Lachnospiraceae bacterium]